MGDAITMSQPIPYSDDLEQAHVQEEDHIQRCIDSLYRTNALTFDVHRHGYRATHAKSHGILRGELVVHDELAPELAQGLFATPGRHPAIIRIATETGRLDDDRKPNARGLALKVFGVVGETMHPTNADHRVHDILFNTLPVLPPGTAERFMEVTELRERHFGDPEALAAAIAALPDGERLSAFDRLAVVHPLADAYYTQSAFRYGDYVAKLALRPGTPEQTALADQDLSGAAHSGVLAERLSAWTAGRETVFELSAQLRTNPETMPVEDASVEWPESESPYQPVATLRLEAQDPYSPARRVFADDRLAFRPWHGLAAHRPLGSVNRLRRRAYEVMGRQRFELNAVRGTEMASADELPG